MCSNPHIETQTSYSSDVWSLTRTTSPGSCVIPSGLIYLFAGSGVNTVQIFDTNSKTVWFTHIILPAAENAMRCAFAFWDNSIYCLGGSTDAYRIQKSNEITLAPTMTPTMVPGIKN